MAERRELTEREKARAERAMKLWLAKKQAQGLTQAHAAEALDMTTSAFNQYIRGVVPMNTDATAKIARYLGVGPREIEPDWLAGLSEGGKDVELEALLSISDASQDLEAARQIVQKLAPKTAMRLARLLFDRAEEGL